MLSVDRAIGDRWLVTKGLAAGDQGDRRRPPESPPGRPGAGRPVRPQGGPRQGAAGEGPARGGQEEAAAMSRFFLDRPVFAWVIAIAMMLGGGLAIYFLPISQYPPIAPPSIVDPGLVPRRLGEDGGGQRRPDHRAADDRPRQDDLHALDQPTRRAAPVELTFAPGHRPRPGLGQGPEQASAGHADAAGVVQRQGLTVAKSTRNYLIMVGLTSDDGSMDQEDLMDYAISQVQSVIARVPGVGEVETFGTGYAMRVWLDPDKLTKYGMTVGRGGGRRPGLQRGGVGRPVGGAPAVPGQRLNASILVQSLLVTPEEFANDPASQQPGRVGGAGERRGADGAWARSWPTSGCSTTGSRPAGLAVRQEAGANALDTADRGQGQDGGLSRVLPGRDEGRLSLRHDALHAGGDRRGGQDPDRGDHPGLPGHVPLPGEPAGDTGPHHRRAGRASWEPSACSACSATPSTC